LTLKPPNFSLFNLVDWQDTSSIFTERRALLARWSHSIEKTILERGLPVDMLAGFQLLDRIAPVLPRYRQIATVAHSVTVIGLPSTTLDLTGLNILPLDPGDKLAREWFLIVRHSDYNRALIAREIDHAPHSFRGILTSDPEQVGRFFEALKLPQRA
jgi:DICT domain-containing protein